MVSGDREGVCFSLGSGSWVNRAPVDVLAPRNRRAAQIGICGKEKGGHRVGSRQRTWRDLGAVKERWRAVDVIQTRCMKFSKN